MSLDRAELKSLSLPKRMIEPFVAEEKTPCDNPRRFPCDAPDCKEIPTTSFLIVYGEEGREQEDERLHCDKHKDDVLYYWHEY